MYFENYIQSKSKCISFSYNKSNISEANFDDLLGSSSEDEAESTETGGESVKKYRVRLACYMVILILSFSHY